jgi:hypothetical protein
MSGMLVFFTLAGAACAALTAELQVGSLLCSGYFAAIILRSVRRRFSAYDAGTSTATWLIGDGVVRIASAVPALHAQFGGLITGAGALFVLPMYVCILGGLVFIVERVVPGSRPNPAS